MTDAEGTPGPMFESLQRQTLGEIEYEGAAGTQLFRLEVRRYYPGDPPRIAWVYRGRLLIGFVAGFFADHLKASVDRDRAWPLDDDPAFMREVLRLWRSAGFACSRGLEEHYGLCE